ncbi:MAG TPA: DUF3105 domain-containing protein [Acidimicrobiales bacterium]|nr:DUF3105 domain-containing protein [Acidimicrobiales bacterium]
MRRRGAAALAAFTLLAGACGGGSDGDDNDNVGPPDDGMTGGCVADSNMDVYSAPGIVHTDAPGYAGPLGAGPAPTYTVNPPSGGDHLAQAARPGVYAGLNIVPDGNLVHALEHGYVILWYRSDVPVAEVTTVRAVRDTYPRDTLVVERKDMPVPIAATAWQQRLLCQRADADDLGDFVEKARSKAPEKVPH